MVRFIQIVIGPAGVGKSTYCKTMQEHGKTTKRTIHVANLDPAAESFGYDAAFDVRDLVSLEDAMDQFGYGPNGGLVYCMEFLFQNIDWLREELEAFDEDDYIIFDCPGQVELYSHLPVMRDLARTLVSWGFRVMSVYLMDALFVLEPAKFISGCMLSLSCMLQLELPHINIVTKCDIADKEQVATVLESEGAWMVDALGRQSSSPAARRMSRLTSAISSVIDDYMIVSFIMLDPTEEESIEDVLAKTDHTIQYGEDIEPRIPRDEDMDYDQDDA